MKTKTTLLLLFALVLLIGCSSDENDESSLIPNNYSKNPELLGFWKMVGDDPWQSKPISFGDNYCLYADDNGFRQLDWKTSNSGELILESLDPEAAEPPLQFEFILDGVGLQLTQGSETLTYERPTPETISVDTIALDFSIPAGTARVLAMDSGEIIEVIASNLTVGPHRFDWNIDPAIENGSYALDIQRTINDSMFTVCRKYIELTR